MPTSRTDLLEEPKNHALGRSRGRFSSKIHWVSDSFSTPLAATVSEGEAHDSRFFKDVILKVSIPVKISRLRNRPKEVVADKGRRGTDTMQIIQECI